MSVLQRSTCRKWLLCIQFTVTYDLYNLSLIYLFILLRSLFIKRNCSRFSLPQFCRNTILPANIRLGEDVLKMSWRWLQHVFSVTFFCLLRRLQDALKTSSRHNCKTSCKHVLETSWRRLEDVLGRLIANTSWRRLGRWKSITLKMSSRRLEDGLENKKCLLGT